MYSVVIADQNVPFVVVYVHRDDYTDLSQVSGAFDGVGLSADFVEHGEQDGDEDPNDADDDQQFDEGEPLLTSNWRSIHVRGVAGARAAAV